MERRDVKRRDKERPSGAATSERPVKSAQSADEKRRETNGEERFERRSRKGRFARNRTPKAGEFDGGKSSDGARIRARPIERRVLKSFVETTFEVFVGRRGRRFEFEAAELVDEAHIARTVGVGSPTVVKTRAHLKRGRDRAPGQPVIAERPRSEGGVEKDDGGRGDDEKSGKDAAFCVEFVGRGNLDGSALDAFFGGENEKSERKREKRREREGVKPTRTQINGRRRKEAERDAGNDETNELRRRVVGEETGRVCGI